MLSVRRDRELLKKLGLTDVQLDELAKHSWTEFTPEMAVESERLTKKIVAMAMADMKRKWVRAQALYDLIDVFHREEDPVEIETLDEAEAHIKNCEACLGQFRLLAKEITDFVK